MNHQPKVFAIVLNWNNPGDTITCISQLKQSNYTNLSILVVDNGSNDNSVEILSQAFSNLLILRNEENLGYAGGNLTGVNYALNNGADYVCIINNDLIIGIDTISKLVIVSEKNKNQCLCSPKIMFTDFKQKTYYEGLFFNKKTGLIGSRQSNIAEKPDVFCDFIQGSCFLVSTELIRNYGFIRTDLFLYYEEFDYCLKLSKHNISFICVSDTVCYHKVEGTFLESPIREYYRTRNNLIILHDNFSKKNFLRYLLFFIYNKTKFHLRNRSLPLCYATCKGFFHGLIHKTGKYSEKHIS